MSEVTSQSYPIPAKRSVAEYEIKKSRFIGWACPAADRAEALQWLNQARQQYPDARHHCWAYLIGPPHSPATAAMSDDGEPSGTAGKPILNVLQHKDVGDVMLIVIRYFGGIKLGAGGLVRAYSQAAQMAMDELTLATFEQMDEATLVCRYEQENELRHWLETHQGEVVDIDYQQSVTVHCQFPAKHQQDWQGLVEKLGAALKSS